MKRKKLLFVAPNYYDFNTVVYNGLVKYSGYEVTHITSNGDLYIYKNLGERILNFFSKTFLRKNLKKIWVKNQITEILDSHEHFDLMIANRPDVLSTEELNKALAKSEKKVFLLWDSLDKIEAQKELTTKFDICCSFDSSDCLHYGFFKINNFYFAKEVQQPPFEYAVSYLGTYDQRIKDVIQLFEYFEHHDIKAKCKLFTYPCTKIKEKTPANIEEIHTIIPFSSSFTYYLDSKIIVDFAHENQKGLSFRPFEAIGLKKKLITTNKEIVHYDFYNPQNIFIVHDIKNIQIPLDFFSTDYQDLPAEIEQKYFIKNWIETICNV